ncbi:MAG TPA: hypothetical protein PKH54_11705 [Myxococcota bacterium]|nr:hypothetical protein [Myxococcota bacterium]HOD00602.1 hypothetical protein [Myxococcota bacterium]HOH77756.1 hypothetical protein [Myxococcota bacterium]HPV04915.1 hypothetical protein [Myxococcota bacterium]
MTYCRAVILVAVLVGLVVGALLLKDDIAGLLSKDAPATGTPAAVVGSPGPSTDRNAQERLSDHPARFWDAVGEGK